MPRTTRCSTRSKACWLTVGVTMADLKSLLQVVRPELLRRRRPHPLPPVVLSVHRAERRGRYESWAGRLDGNGRGGHGRSERVAHSVGYDPDEVSGLAFGLGIERVCARRHGVTDIREFYKNDVRFLHQF